MKECLVKKARKLGWTVQHLRREADKAKWSREFLGLITPMLAVRSDLSMEIRDTRGIKVEESEFPPSMSIEAEYIDKKDRPESVGFMDALYAQEQQMEF